MHPSVDGLGVIEDDTKINVEMKDSSIIKEDPLVESKELLDQTHKDKKPTSETERVPDPVPKAEIKTNVPLPNKLPPKEPILPRVAERLREEGIIEEAVLQTVLEVWSTKGTKAAALPLLEAWWQAHQDGHRIMGGLEVFQPDPSLGLKPSSFNPQWLQVMMAGEQPEVTDYLVTGFVHGFMLGPRDDPIQFDAADYPNHTVTDPAEEAALRKGTLTELSFGCIGTPSKEMEESMIISPIFGVPKKKDGYKTGEFRQAQHLSKASNVSRSVNDYISEEDAAIQFESI